jgi:hypothetical protein
MKKIIAGIALVGLAAGCRSDRNSNVSDPSAANMPKAECCAGAKKTDCCDAAKADGQKKACCQKADAAPQN